MPPSKANLSKPKVGGSGDVAKRIVQAVATVKKNDARLRKVGIVVNTKKILGSPGSFGVAFEVTAQGRRCAFKVTTDWTEAHTSFGIIGKRLSRVVSIYAVFRFKDTVVYGILQELLQPLSDDEAERFDDLTNMLRVGRVGVAMLAGNVAAVKAGVLKALRRDDAREDFIELFDRFDFGGILEELHKNGIDFLDFHSGNLMKRGSTYVVIDLGMSQNSAAAGVPPVLEWKSR